MTLLPLSARGCLPADTTADAQAKQIEILRGMDTGRRAEIAFELSDNLRQIVEAGVHLRHPNWDDQAVRLEVFRLVLGESLFREAFGDSASQV